MNPFEHALSDFYKTGKADNLWLHNSYDEPEEMPVGLFFRTEEEMPFIELKAIELCKGKILDVGAGAGSHALLLQEIGKDVTALEISKTATEIMRSRGVNDVLEGNLFELQANRFDTLLFLMNGVGLTGTLQRLKDWLPAAHDLLNTGGQILFDSSDISYLYEDGIKPETSYFGEISYCYEYKGIKGDWFDWLYIDQQTLKDIAGSAGWDCEIIYENDEDQYLARLVIG